MLLQALMIVLAYGKPQYDEKLLNGCYDNEDADTCSRRQKRWKDDIKRWEDENKAIEDSQFEAFARENDKSLPPAEGAETVPAQSPSWCDVLDGEAGSSWSAVARNLNNFQNSRYLEMNSLATAAAVLCQKPEDPVVKKVTASLLQVYVNTTGVSAAEAPRNMKLRMSAKLVTAKKSLCSELAVDEEALGAAKTFGEARRTFFGCSDADKTDSAEWTGGGGQFGFSKLLWYLDSAAQPDSELMRLAYLLDTVRTPADDSSYKAGVAATYAWLSYDIKNFDSARLKKEFEAAPFKGNDWATLTLSESLGLYQKNARSFDAFVKKTAKDDDWKNILSGAPEKAIKEWEAQAAKYKDAFKDAREFEDKLFAPSLKAGKGCAAKLKPAFHAFLRGVKAKPSEFNRAVSGDMVGSYLLQHLTACAMIEGDVGFSHVLEHVRTESRLVRGPRLAAYYAAVEAVGQVKADRPKFPLEPSQLWSPAADDIERRTSEAEKGSITLLPETGSIVKSVSKTPKGTKVVFITEKYQYMSQTCTPTNRIYRINSSGVVEYYSNCKDAGMQTGTRQVKDLLVPNEYAEGIAAGRWVDFVSSPTGDGFQYPTAVYSDKSKSKLINWNGFAL